MKSLLALAALSAMCHLSLAHQGAGAICFSGDCDERQLLYCWFQHSSCVTGTCECYKGYAYSTEANKCVLKKTKVGESCRVQEECPTGSKCTNKYICECDPAVNAANSEEMSDHMACRDKSATAIIGEVCTVGTTKCYGYNGGVFTDLGSGNDVCVANNCNCTTATHTGSGKACVLDTYVIGSACTGSGQCPTLSSCKANVCQCNQGLFPVNGMTACLANALEVKHDCSTLNATTACANTLLCHRCVHGAFDICTESVAIESMPVIVATTVNTTKVQGTTEPFGQRAGASRSVFSMATSILAVLAFLM